MKDWNSDEKPSRWLWLEATAASVLVLLGYAGLALWGWQVIEGWLS